KVERKIASSETIMVSRPYGYASTPRAIQAVNQTTCRYTKRMEPLNSVMWSARRFSKLRRRSRACSIRAGLIRCGGPAWWVVSVSRMSEGVVKHVERVRGGGVDVRDPTRRVVGDVHPQAAGSPGPEQRHVDIVRSPIGKGHDLGPFAYHQRVVDIRH